MVDLPNGYFDLRGCIGGGRGCSWFRFEEVVVLVTEAVVFLD